MTQLYCVNDLQDINTASHLSHLFLYYYLSSLAPIISYVSDWVIYVLLLLEGPYLCFSIKIVQPRSYLELYKKV